MLTTMTFRTPDEAVTKASQCVGLSAGVWTEKGRGDGHGRGPARRRDLDNTFNRFDPAASFGGYKESGFGREGGPRGWRPIDPTTRIYR